MMMSSEEEERPPPEPDGSVQEEEEEAEEDEESDGNGSGVAAAANEGDGSSSSEPVVKVKTLVEYHLEFLTRHPGEALFYGCRLCARRFTSRHGFLTHMKLHRDVRKRYPCGVCERAFDRKFQLVHHLRLHTSDTPFECAVCFVAFADERRLAEHARVHTSAKPFECRYCLKGFPQKKALIVHLRMHTGERPFPCEFCERTFTQKAHLQGHMVRIHIPKKKVEYSNDMQPTTDKSVLNMFAQMKERLAAVGTFANHAELRINPVMSDMDIAALTGQREKLIECDYCDKKFTYERNKTNHMKKHTGEAQFDCEQCQRAFPSRNSLASHLLTHMTSGSPFRCDICAREFNMKRNLIMHVKSHNNERPYECPACEKSFKLKYFLELHLTRIHPHIRFDDLPHRKEPQKQQQPQLQQQQQLQLHQQLRRQLQQQQQPLSLCYPLPEKVAAAMKREATTPNKRKQTQPKKVVKLMEVGGGGGESGGESNDGGGGDEDYSSESETDSGGGNSANPAKFVEVYLHEPKNNAAGRREEPAAGEARSLQINLPHDLRHVKKMLNAKSSLPAALPPPLVVPPEAKNVSCPLCPVMVSSKAVLAIHMKEHDKSKPHQCTMCDKVYIQQASFEKHMRKHLLDGTPAGVNATGPLEHDGYRLNYFPQIKSDDSYGDSNVVHVKGDGRKPLECKICRKKYAQPASFEKHMRQHSELEEAKSETMAFTENVYEKLKALQALKYAESNHMQHEQSDGGSVSAAASAVSVVRNNTPEGGGGFINPSDFLEVSIDHS